MTPDDSPEGRKTTEIELPPKWAIALTEKVNALTSASKAMADDVTELHEAVRHIREDVADFRKDACGHLHKLDGTVDEINEWRGRTSDRVKGVSESDLKQSADIAAVIARVDNLGEAVKESTNAQTAVLVTKLDALSKNPTVKIIVGILGALLAGWAAGKGITIK